MEENKRIEGLPEVRAAVAALSPEDRKLLAAVQESPHRLTSLEQFKEFSKNSEYFILKDNIHSEADLGWRYIAEHMDILLPKELLEAIDPVPFGKYAMEDEQGFFYFLRLPVSLSGDEWQREHVTDRPHQEAEKSPPSGNGWNRAKRMCRQADAAPGKGQV